MTSSRKFFRETIGRITDIDDEIVDISNELHRRLKVQARNLLFEYRFAAGENRGQVPVDQVEGLMRIYGYLIIKLLVEKNAEIEALKDVNNAAPEPAVRQKPRTVKG